MAAVAIQEIGPEEMKEATWEAAPAVVRWGAVAAAKVAAEEVQVAVEMAMEVVETVAVRVKVVAGDRGSPVMVAAMEVVDMVEAAAAVMVVVAQVAETVAVATAAETVALAEEERTMTRRRRRASYDLPACRCHCMRPRTSRRRSQ